jgi:hypothetical protein
LSNPTEYTASLKLLQDLCSISGEIPSSFYLKDVTVDRNEQFGGGGEALVYGGRFNGQRVVVREIRTPRRRYWRSPDGQRTIKVIKRILIAQFMCH